MSKPIAVIVLLLAAGIGFAAGRWAERPPEVVAPVPPTRSRSIQPEPFEPVGVAHDVREALLVQDLLERTARLSTLLAGLGPESLESVRSAYDTVLLDLDDTDLVLFAEWWARFDPQAALRWSDENWSARQSVPVHRAVMRAWGRSDPRTALNMVLTAPSDAVRRRWMDAILRGWDESVEDGALQYAESLPPGPERQWALFVVARRMVLRDGAAAAVAWAEALPDDDPLFKQNAFRRIAAATAAVDPTVATAFVERHLDGPYASSLALRAGLSWVLYDPEATFAWLSTLPASPDRDEAVRETYFQWAALDRSAAQTWIESVEPARWVDPALAVRARGMASSEPRDGLAFAESIGDEEIRRVAQGHIARMWLRSDAAAANAWLEQSGLPPRFIEKVKAGLTPPGAAEERS